MEIKYNFNSNNFRLLSISSSYQTSHQRITIILRITSRVRNFCKSRNCSNSRTCKSQEIVVILISYY